MTTPRPVASSRPTEPNTAPSAEFWVLSAGRPRALFDAKPLLRSQFANVFVTAADGRMLAYADAAGVRRPEVSLGDRDYFRRTLAERRAIVSEPVPGRVSGEPVVVFTQPLVDRNGAVLAANDKIACGIMQAANDAGLRVPDQIRIVGFNDSQISRLVRPRLSTIALPMAEMGAMAVRLLVRRIEDRSAEVVCSRLPTKLIVRESSTVVNF